MMARPEQSAHGVSAEVSGSACHRYTHDLPTFVGNEGVYYDANGIENKYRWPIQPVGTGPLTQNTLACAQIGHTGLVANTLSNQTRTLAPSSRFSAPAMTRVKPG